MEEAYEHRQRPALGCTCTLQGMLDATAGGSTLPHQQMRKGGARVQRLCTMTGSQGWNPTSTSNPTGPPRTLCLLTLRLSTPQVFWVGEVHLLGGPPGPWGKTWCVPFWALEKTWSSQQITWSEGH